MSDHNPELDQWRSDGAYQTGYDAAIKDVVAYLVHSAMVSKDLWLESEGTHIGEYHRGGFNAEAGAAEAIERGDAKGTE